MRLFLAVILLSTTVHGAFDAASYTNYLMTASMEDIRDNYGRPEIPRIAPHDIRQSSIYEISMKGPKNVVEGEDIKIEVKLTSGTTTYYSGNVSVDGLFSISVGDGIHLFKDTPDGGWAFLYLDNKDVVEFNNSDLGYLPKVPGKDVTAPLVINGSSVDISEMYIYNNYHSVKAGGIYVTGGSQVNMKQGQIIFNEAEVGGVVADGKSLVTFDEVQIYQNKGTKTGAVHVEEKATFVGTESSFFGNSTGVMQQECTFQGESASEDYKACLLDSSVTDVKTCGNGNEAASSVLYVDTLASLTLVATTLSNHSTKRGTILSSGQSSINIRQANFINNIAHTGGGIYVLNARGSAAIILSCKFHNNLARYGGAVVLSGNGTFSIQGCHFERNEAIIGGAVWGNTSYDLANTTASGGKASSVSRLTIANSDFINNSAITEGGALSVKWTDIRANLTSFHNNVAGGSGGAIYTDNAYNLNFLDCEFSSNFANASGGAIFAVNAYDIYATNSIFSNHSATSNGGTIASIDGHGIIVHNTTITSSHTYSNGGAIFTDNVNLFNAFDSDIVNNQAEGSGGALSLRKFSSLSLDSVDLSGNVAFGSGGVFDASEGIDAAVRNINISNTNSSSSIISLGSRGIVELSGFNFEGIKDKSVCGGLNIDGASFLTISDMKFVDNEVRGHGGALCLQNISYGNLRNLEFSNNLAGIDGGAVYIAASNEVNFTNVEFKVNSATYQGGAIKGVNVRALILDETVFSSNRAQWKGGAICLEKSSISIQKSMFSHNYAGSNSAAFPNRTSVHTRALNFPSSGVVYVEGGSNFYSQNSTYEFNEADTYGGSLTLNNINEALIQGDTYLNGTAAMSGGCILASTVRSLEIWDTRLRYCKAAFGGAIMIEGHSTVNGGYSFFEENSAENGGAILCQGSSGLELQATNFSFNSAKDGSTASIACRCDMNFSTSAFYRDKHLDNNGDFFHTDKGCGSINSEDCKFVGGKHHRRSFPWLYIIIGGACLLAIMVILVILRRKKQASNDTIEDIETGSVEDPLVTGKRRRKARYQTTMAASRSSSTEEYSSSESETTYSEDDSSSTEGSSYSSTEESETESEKSSHRHHGKRKESVPKHRAPKKKGTREQESEITPSEDYEPIGKRTHAAQKIVAHRRKASKDKVNDGAGPSTSHTSVMPPDLDPVTPEEDTDEESGHNSVHDEKSSQDEA
eukprot:g4769.t1